MAQVQSVSGRLHTQHPLHIQHPFHMLTPPRALLQRMTPPTSKRSTSLPPSNSSNVRISCVASVDFFLEDCSVPTPVLPSGPMMAQFLLAYRKTLEHAHISGDGAAAAGANVLERVRVGLMGLLGHPCHGASPNVGAAWLHDEREIEACLWELERDINSMQQAHDKPPRKVSIQLACIHCTEAARLLRRL